MNIPFPLVSIIIPCFNDGAYLREAVASSQAQTYSKCEIIVVNDHSNDALTCAVLRQLAEEGISIIETPEGTQGQPIARNTAISQARGIYILPLDADDKIAPTYVEKAVRCMEMQPNIRICTCKVAFFGLRRGLWKRKTAPDLWGLLSLTEPVICTSLFRRADWEAVGGYSEILHLGHEDAGLWIALLELGGTIYEIDEVLFEYRIKPFSACAKIASPDMANAAAKALHQVHAPIYARFTENFLLTLRHYHMADNQRNTSFIYRFVKPLMGLEWQLRQWIKRRLGRA